MILHYTSGFSYIAVLLHLIQSTLSCTMASEEDVKQRQIVEDRARNISHNVRCTECGSQSIEDSQADVAVLLRRVHFPWI
jgi:cytochrome c-type biogenesis protein CcmH/NrfF